MSSGREQGLSEQSIVLKAGVTAQRQMTDLYRAATKGRWQWIADRVACGQAAICYVGEYDGKFIAAAHELVPDLLRDMARMRRIEGAARELMAFLSDVVMAEEGGPEGIAIVASDARHADALRDRLNALDQMLGGVGDGGP